MDQYRLSTMENKNFSKAVGEIYLLTDYNHLQYPDYYKWYYGKSIPRILNQTGEIIFYLDGLVVAGIAILKKDQDESKICTFMMAEEYRKKGYAKALLESSFNYLKTDKPLITIPTNRLDEFSKIIKAYDWQESLRTDQYFTEEVIFNESKKLRKINNRSHYGRK